MAGSPKSVNTDTPIDSKYLQYINSLSSGGNTTNITSSRDSIKQYVKTKNGIFNGAFGSVGNASYISSGTLDLTANSTGAVVVRRMIYVMPESSNSDIIDNIETNGLELPYQELTLFSSTNNTITIAHNSSAGGTKKNIYCPGDTSYVLAPNEAVKLIYDPINTLWIVTGNASSSGGVTNPVNTSLDLGGNTIQKVTTLFLNGDIDNANSIAGNVGGLDYNVDDTDETHDFKIDGTTKFSVGNSAIYASTNLSILTGNAIYLDNDVDTFIYAAADDNINIVTNNVVRMAISNFSTIMAQDIDMYGNDMLQCGELKFIDSALPTATATAITALSGAMHYNATSNDSHFFKINGTTEVEIDADGLDIRNGWLELEERSAPSGLSNHTRLYAKDNGSGKTQLVVIFGSGAEQVIATEP